MSVACNLERCVSQHCAARACAGAGAFRHEATGKRLEGRPAAGRPRGSGGATPEAFGQRARPSLPVPLHRHRPWREAPPANARGHCSQDAAPPTPMGGPSAPTSLTGTGARLLGRRPRTTSGVERGAGKGARHGWGTLTAPRSPPPHLWLGAGRPSKLRSQERDCPKQCGPHETAEHLFRRGEAVSPSAPDRLARCRATALEGLLPRLLGGAAIAFQSGTAARLDQPHAAATMWL